MTMLSAIIPTRDRPDLLADCLATLARQDVPTGLLEVIVVDDGSDVDLRATVEAVGGPVPMRYVRQEPSGLNVGRNHGAALARSDLFAYLDDDTLVSPGWALAMVDAFETFACDAVAGRTELLLEGPEPRWLSRKLRQYLAECDLGPDACWMPAGSVPVGANCAVSRHGFERAGAFALGLDRIGGSLVSNGDTEFFLRLIDRGGSIAYAPDASVHHRVPPHRLTREFFLRRAHAQGVSDVLMTRTHGAVAFAREAARAARAVPIAGRNVAEGRGLTGARVWLAYCEGRVDAMRGSARTAH